MGTKLILLGRIHLQMGEKYSRMCFLCDILVTFFVSSLSVLSVFPSVTSFQRAVFHCLWKSGLLYQVENIRQVLEIHQR